MVWNVSKTLLRGALKSEKCLRHRRWEGNRSWGTVTTGGPRNWGGGCVGVASDGWGMLLEHWMWARPWMWGTQSSKHRWNQMWQWRHRYSWSSSRWRWMPWQNELNPLNPPRQIHHHLIKSSKSNGCDLVRHGEPQLKKSNLDVLCIITIIPSISARGPVTTLKPSKTLKQTHASDKTKQHKMLHRITTHKMYDTKQW